MATHEIATRDGRTLTVEDAGAPDGAPVVVHHGTPGSRLLYGPHIRGAEEIGVRLIGYDRPGYGGSTPQPGRTVADAAADVEAICDGLGLGRVATWGASGGGPHALACAALLPERVAAAASIAGVAPYGVEGLDWLEGMGQGNIEEFGAALEGRDVLAPFVERMAAEMIDATPESIYDALDSLLSPVDRAVLTGELAVFLLEATRLGIGDRRDGWVEDDLVFARPWGFELDAIRAPVQVWQGGEDRFVPFAHGKWLAAHVPGAEAHLEPDDGHLTLTEGHLPDIHRWLIGHL